MLVAKPLENMISIRYLFFIRWVFYFTIISIIPIEIFAQDTVTVYQDTLQVIAVPRVEFRKIEPNCVKWEYGFFVGGSGTLYTNKSGASIKNSVGWAFGLEVDYMNIFSKLNVAWAESIVKSEFSNMEAWPDKLPLDLIQFYFALGYRYKLSSKIHIKPMFYITHLGYTTDESIIDFTGINRSANVGYYGIALGFLVDTFIPSFKFLRYELTTGFGHSIDKIDETIFPKYAWNVSIGLLFLFSER